MTVRYVIRPADIATTPRLLKTALNAQRTIAFPFQGTRRPSILKDFFLTYPPLEDTEEYAQSISHHPSRNPLVSRTIHNRRIRGTTGSMGHLGINATEEHFRCMDNYSSVRNFFTKSKPTQRKVLADAGLNVPWTSYINAQFGTLERPARCRVICANSGNTVFVKRPTRHRGGSGWSVLSNSEAQVILQRPDSVTTGGSEYIQQVLPKDHEYRIILCRGKALITLLKRNSEGLSPLVPWNHQQGSSFVTVENMDNNRLRRTDIYQKLEQIELLKHIDLCAIDVIYLKSPARYFVLELNFCPGLTIESNIEKVKQHVLHSS